MNQTTFSDFLQRQRTLNRVYLCNQSLLAYFRVQTHGGWAGKENQTNIWWIRFRDINRSKNYIIRVRCWVWLKKPSFLGIYWLLKNNFAIICHHRVLLLSLLQLLYVSFSRFSLLRFVSLPVTYFN